MQARPNPLLLDMEAVGHILNITAAEAAGLVTSRKLRGFQQGGDGVFVTRPADIGDYLAEQGFRCLPALAHTIKS
jgi:hypothetical protein